MKDYSLINSVFIANTFKPGSKKSVNILKSIQKLISMDFLDSSVSMHFPAELNQKFDLSEYKKAEETVNYCKSKRYGILTYFDKDYPDSMRKLDNPPVVLYYIGNLPDFNNSPSITLIGPRRPSDNGLRFARQLSYRFANAGITVVSGGGAGCEEQAHLGSLKIAEKTVSVIPCGFDTEYYKRNPLLNEIADSKGCILSEFYPKTPILKFNYPLRNRIMAAISDISLLVEAGEGSGSLLTAKNALDMGKDVYAIPGNPTQPEYTGSNHLFLSGAKPFVDIGIIFDYFSSKFPGKIDTNKRSTVKKSTKSYKNNQKIVKISKETLSNEAKIVYNYLDKPVFSMDDLSSLQLSPNEILSALTELELEQLITPVAGGKYKII